MISAGIDARLRGEAAARPLALLAVLAIRALRMDFAR
jgi:hypothetical protein